ncbi:uncharacterized protein LOC127778247 [Oryza glaberrima]|uniref:DUF1618 domain-containing protein n=1 Tax=Oryza glaberrima TaxID=4538 RepID=I1QB23_ORYGL|nr:uncharacterized protein LOC127778247 [Oryza glaberrima]
MCLLTTSMAGKERSHVHLCLTDYRDGTYTYTVHHIDVAPFFLRSDDPDVPDPGAMEEAVLPPPATRLATRPETNGLEFHHLLRAADGGDMIVATDDQRRTLIYDVAARAVGPGHMLLSDKRVPVSAAVADRLYVLDTSHAARRATCFEALVYDGVEDPLRADWYWRRLPGPPYADDGIGRPLPGSRVTALAVVGAGIWATTAPAEDGVASVRPCSRLDPRRGVWTTPKGAGAGPGTYSFDTERQAWRREGDWELPFAGKAELVPSCNLWFGFSRADGSSSLCAADLAAAPHRACGVWEDFRPPKEWFSCGRHLVSLGSGKLCVVRFFATDPLDKWRRRDPVAIITAMEVRTMPACDGDDDGGRGGERRIKVVKHMSRCIKLPNYNKGRNWVL